MANIEQALNVSEDVLERIEEYIDEELVGSEFLICDDDGRYEKVREEIEMSVWAFNSSFIQAHISRDIINRALDKLQELCEDANDIILALIDDFGSFVEDAVMSDGHGHFLSPYDGNEYEYTDDETGETYYIYILN